MELPSWLQGPPKAADHQNLNGQNPDLQDLDDRDLDDAGRGLAWNQNARILLAVIIVILSAFVVYWILS